MHYRHYIEAMTPEEKARVKIDKLFQEAGWSVVDRDQYTPALTAAAIREGLLGKNLRADYFLFINGKAVGVLEAKRAEIDPSTSVVAEQAEGYIRSVPSCYQAYQSPLPLIYTSNGEYTYFRDSREKESELTAINRIHKPKEIVKMLGITDFWAGLPTLQKKGLRDCQFEAITELETSFRTGQDRALMVLATGAGKTYTAVTAAYRFLNYTLMRRVLFLVDRNNLAKQAEGEFGMYRLTENGDAFNNIFGVNRLRSSKVPKDANVIISTIHRVFALLTGQEINDNEEEEEETNEDGKTVELSGNLQLPHDLFDLIVIDECHRSIYGRWKAVLEYFDTAKLIGLTATPIPETKAFFNNNIVINYTLEKSIIDGVNVDCRVYRIKTEATENGGAIRKGDPLRRETRYTGKVEIIRNVETSTYTKEELNRSIINPSQIKLILETYRDSVYTEMFTEPQREANFDYLPKTLIFALNEKHATNIVRIAKEVFNRDDDQFVQKITYSANDSNDLIRQFRNNKEFRIAVTCTLVATGTDVKPLEVVMFMRDVASEPLYIQMKGRGVRTIGDEQLRAVTPNAVSKDCFFLVDAVGVTESAKVITTPGEEQPATITLERLLELLAHGNVNDENLRLLAARLARIHNKSNEEQRKHFTDLAHIEMSAISASIYNALESGALPEYKNINEPNNERKGLVAVIVNHPEARKYLLILNAGFVNTLQPGEDTLISKGFSQEEAVATVSAFEEYCNAHCDEIEALRIIYNNTGEPLTYALILDLERKLRQFDSKFTTSMLWNNYAILYPDKVKKRSTKEEQKALTNIIQLVRKAYHQIERLESLYPAAAQRFSLWYGQRQRLLTDAQIEVIRQIVNYVASNGALTIKEIREMDKDKANALIRVFGNMTAVNETIESLSAFILTAKVA